MTLKNKDNKTNLILTSLRELVKKLSIERKINPVYENNQANNYINNYNEHQLYDDVYNNDQNNYNKFIKI